MKIKLQRPIIYILTSCVLMTLACGTPGNQEAMQEKQKADSIANAQVKMEEAKEEALRRARVMEDSLQQSSAASSKE